MIAFLSISHSGSFCGGKKSEFIKGQYSYLRDLLEIQGIFKEILLFYRNEIKEDCVMLIFYIDIHFLIKSNDFLMLSYLRSVHERMFHQSYHHSYSHHYMFHSVLYNVC